jgi:flavin-dependent dehydrogenase
MKVVICGAGIAGLTLANRVSVLGGEVVLLERAPGPPVAGVRDRFLRHGLRRGRGENRHGVDGCAVRRQAERRVVDLDGRRRFAGELR